MGKFLAAGDPHSHPDNANLPIANQPAALWGVTISFLSIAIITTIVRLWVRIRDRLWGFDDAFVFLACLASVAGDSIVCSMPHDGLGLHFWTLDAAHRMSYLRHVYGTHITYCASAALIKLSILFQFLRLFTETTQSTRTPQHRMACRLTWALIILTSLWGLAFILLASFSCSPVAKNWKPQLAGTCVGWGSERPDKFFPVYLGHSISNSVLDLMVLALPIRFLGTLRLAERSRVGLITLYCLGCIAGSVAVGRMITLSVKRAGTVSILDMTYHAPLLYIFGVLEVNVAIVAASIPIFWPVMVKLAVGKIFVVNEVEVHVESASRVSFGSARAIEISDTKDSYGSRRSRLSLKTRSYDRRRSRSSHGPQKSDTSSVGKGIGHRPSQDSHRSLYHKRSHEPKISATIIRTEEEEWSADLDRMHMGKTITTVERTHIPLEHMKGF